MPGGGDTSGDTVAARPLQPSEENDYDLHNGISAEIIIES